MGSAKSNIIDRLMTLELSRPFEKSGQKQGPAAGYSITSIFENSYSELSVRNQTINQWFSEHESGSGCRPIKLQDDSFLTKWLSSKMTKPDFQACRIPLLNLPTPNATPDFLLGFSEFWSLNDQRPADKFCTGFLWSGSDPGPGIFPVRRPRWSRWDPKGIKSRCLPHKNWWTGWLIIQKHFRKMMFPVLISWHPPWDLRTDLDKKNDIVRILLVI